MKYARLSHKDLNDLEKEFIEFLIINGIQAKEWEQLKSKEKEKAEDVIDQFCDVVWESVLRKASIVEKRSQQHLVLCKIENEKLFTLFLTNKKTGADFTKDEGIEEILFDKKHYQSNLKIEPINQPREEMLFQLLHSGFYIAHHSRYIHCFKSAEND